MENRGDGSDGIEVTRTASSYGGPNVGFYRNAAISMDYKTAPQPSPSRDSS